MSKLDELLDSFEIDGDGWLYYGSVDPKDAAAELAAMRARQDDWRRERDNLLELITDLQRLNRMAWTQDGHGAWLEGGIYDKKIDVATGLPFTTPSAVEPSEAEVRG